MPKRGLHQMDRRAAIESVRGVGVPQPVRGDCPSDWLCLKSLTEQIATLIFIG
jgi:hypothetical protein